MNRLLISIIIPTFNRANLIKRAIDCALKEIITGDEIIVVDDGSTDDTENIISSYKRKIKYFKISNSGAGAARNFGISKSRNPLVAFLDSDDEWMSGKLSLQRAFMETRPDVLLCFTDFAVTFKEGGEAHNFQSNWHKDPRPWDEVLGRGEHYSDICPLPLDIKDFKFYVGDLYPSMLRNPFVFTGTLIVRREEAGEALRFAEDLKWGEDWVCYGNLARKGPAAFLDFETAWQHGHSGERLTDTSMLDGITTRIDIMGRVWGSDDNFQKTHSQTYARLLRNQKLLKVRELIALGRTAEARSELCNIVSPPISYRILAVIPSIMMRAMLAMRRLLFS
ncbi:MAG: glycosyltransferase family A protein [candidate division Zixibacteria bacterium]